MAALPCGQTAGAVVCSARHWCCYPQTPAAAKAPAPAFMGWQRTTIRRASAPLLAACFGCRTWCHVTAVLSSSFASAGTSTLGVGNCRLCRRDVRMPCCACVFTYGLLADWLNVFCAAPMPALQLRHSELRRETKTVTLSSSGVGSVERTTWCTCRAADHGCAALSFVAAR